MLYNHQINAIEKVCSENFSSGVIKYATGTGKSRIGMEIVKRYNSLNNTKDILWICKHKFILQELFDKPTQIIGNLLIKNFVDNKPTNWSETVQQSKIWGRPSLVIINNTFLTLNEKYKKLNNVGLIIHDECHSITSETIRCFYDWMTKHNDKLCVIGLSATPILTHYPLNRIIINYDIIDAINEAIVTNPTFYYLKTEITMELKRKFDIIVHIMNKSYYKKIIIWCGTINNCDDIYNEWKAYCIHEGINMKSFRSHSLLKYRETKHFNSEEMNAVLFCANEHHEASDFNNLDGCVFMDGVKQRTEKLFMQCLGRVIRKNTNKTHTWILDIDAENIMELCNRFLSFTEKNDKWRFINKQYQYDEVDIFTITISIVEQTNNELLNADNMKNIETDAEKDKEKDIDIKTYFKRVCPNNVKYIERMNEEIGLLKSKNLIKYLMKAIKVQELCEDQIYITRGSCGSSLVCYLLGLSHVDPIKYKISFSRFLHRERDELPDIDFDFPHNIRNDILVKINDLFDGNISRISSFINWQEKSATRKALKCMGYNKKYSNTELRNLLKGLNDSEKERMNVMKKELIGTRRTTMAHVGGIVFDTKTNLKPNSCYQYIDILEEDKKSISSKKIFKIDILSSRGLTILKEIYPEFLYKDLEIFEPCEKTFQLLEQGDNMGLIIAESVLMKRAFMKFKPKSFDDIAYCLAIVRPLAKLSRDNLLNTCDNIVYDDDIINMICKILNCDDGMADSVRRKIIKEDEPTLVMFVEAIYKSSMSMSQIMEYFEIIKRITNYGFCKSHSLSYSMVVWHLAKAKANNPQKFWKAVFNHADSTYKKWVHMIEAVNAGVNINSLDLSINNVSIYSKTIKENRMKSVENLSPYEQLRCVGYWNGIFNNEFYPGCYFEKADEYTEEEPIFVFCGIIAAFRTCRTLKKEKKMGFYIGVDKGKYVDIIISEKSYNSDIIGLKGKCKYHSMEENIMMEYECCELF